MRNLIYGVNWWAICAVLMVASMFVTIFTAVPDVLVLPLGFTGVIAAVFSLQAITTRALPRSNVKPPPPGA